jgi:hypothetical protein
VCQSVREIGPPLDERPALNTLSRQSLFATVSLNRIIIAAVFAGALIAGKPIVTGFPVAVPETE